MRIGIVSLITSMIALQSAVALAEQPSVQENVLINRLNSLESQAVQRQGREPVVSDLLRRQDDRLAGQALNTLKTRNLRNTAIPLLENKLNRSRRPLGVLDRP